MKTFLTTIVLTAFVLACALLIFVLSPVGLKTALALLNHSDDYQLEYQSVTGNILGPIRFKALRMCNTDMCLTSDVLYVNWSPGKLIFHKIAIDEILTSHTILTTKAKHKKQASHSPKKSSTSRYKLQINKLNLQDFHVISSTGNTITFENLAFNININSKQVNVSAGANVTEPFNIIYRATATGIPSKYTIAFSAKGKSTDIRMAGSGNENSLQIASTKAQLSHGTVPSKLQLQWAPYLQWQLDFKANNLQPNQLNPQWPTKLNASIQSQGHIENNHPKFSLNTKVSTPHTQLSLSGDVGQTTHLTWDFNSNKLSELSSLLEGALNSKGSIAGPYQHPTVTATLKATNLIADQLQVKSIDSNFMIDLSQQQASTADIDVQQARLGSHTIHHYSLQVNGTLNNYNVTTSINNSIGTAGLQFKGNQTQGTFNNTIQKLQFNTLHFGQWNLVQPATVKLSSQIAQTNNLCLALASDHNNQSCLNLNWKASKAWQMSFTSAGVDLATITQSILPKSTSLTGYLSVNAQASGLDNKLLSADLSSNTAQGQLHYHLNNINQMIPINSAHTKFQYKKQSIESEIQLELQPNNYMKANFNTSKLDGFSLTSKSPISGSLEIKADNLTDYNAFVPGINLTKGSLEANLHIKGPLTTPNLSGKVSLKNTQFFSDKLGLTFSDINFNLTSSSGVTHYEGTMSSKNTPLTFTGSTNFSQHDWPTNLHLVGSNFELLNNAEYQLFVSPDLTLQTKQKTLTLSGKLAVPHAKIIPYKSSNVKTLPEGDIVYTDTTSSASKTPWHTVIDVKVLLGKKVYLKIIGINGYATGRIHLTKQPSENILGNGLIHIKGSYEAYGHKLDIAKSSMVSYNNSPLTNPNLNLRATKKIANINQNSQQDISFDNVVVGIELTGTLNHPVLGLFSVPADLSTSDILSYLILGHLSLTPTYDPTQTQDQNMTANIFDTIRLSETGLSSSQSAGVTGTVQQTLGLTELGVETTSTLDVLGNQLDQQSYFVLGKFLSPSVYVRYSQGLVYNDDILQLRLFITPNWIVQTEASSLDNGNGIDILYTIER